MRACKGCMLFHAYLLLCINFSKKKTKKTACLGLEVWLGLSRGGLLIIRLVEQLCLMAENLCEYRWGNYG